MVQNLSKAAGQPVTVSFTPLLVPMPRGILSTAPGVALALAQGWVKPAPGAVRRQLEPAPLACKPRPGPGLRRALACYAESAD